MCRIAIIPKRFKNQKFLTELFLYLNKSAGGDGIGIGYFENGIPKIFKGEKITPEQMANKICETNSDNEILFHCRRASVGNINDENCHPYIYGNSVHIHNGQVQGIGILKLMMVENLNKYQADGWTIEKIMTTTDSDLLSYFVWKRGFGIASMLDCGTVVTQYPNEIKIYVGYCLEAIQIGSEWIYASEFSSNMGLASDKWLVFGRGTNITLSKDECVLNSGYYVDGKELYIEQQKKKMKKELCVVETI